MTHPSQVYGEFPCSQCERIFKLEGYLKRHLKSVHKPPSKALVKLPVNGFEFKRVEGFIILEDNKGGVWLAEKIR